MNVVPMAKSSGQSAIMRYSADPMDRWLREQLRDLCQEAMNRPLPPNLQKLSREFEQALKRNMLGGTCWDSRNSGGIRC